MAQSGAMGMFLRLLRDEIKSMRRPWEGNQLFVKRSHYIKIWKSLHLLLNEKCWNLRLYCFYDLFWYPGKLGCKGVIKVIFINSLKQSHSELCSGTGRHLISQQIVKVPPLCTDSTSLASSTLLSCSALWTVQWV